MPGLPKHHRVPDLYVLNDVLKTGKIDLYHNARVREEWEMGVNPRTGRRGWGLHDKDFFEDPIFILELPIKNQVIVCDDQSRFTDTLIPQIITSEEEALKEAQRMIDEERLRLNTALYELEEKETKITIKEIAQ